MEWCKETLKHELVYPCQYPIFIAYVRSCVHVHTEKSILNLAESNQNQIVFNIFQLILNQTHFRLINSAINWFPQTVE